MKIIASLGLFIAIIPFLGVPSSWKTILFVVLGLFIFIKSFLVYRFEKEKEFLNNTEKGGEKNNGDYPFKQNNNFISESDKSENEADSFLEDSGTDSKENIKKRVETK